MYPRHSGRRRRLDLVGDGEHRSELALDGNVEACFAIRSQPRRIRRQGCHVDTRLCHHSIRADLDTTAIHVGGRTETGSRRERRRRGDSQVPRAGGGDDRGGERMLGCGFDGRRQGDHLIFVEAGGGQHVRQRRASISQRAGLVEGDEPGVAQSLQRVAIAKQHAERRRAAGPDHDGHGRGKTHGAGAGDDEHRYGCDQRQRKRGRRREDHPAGERQRRRDDDRRHEPVRDPVDLRLDRQLGALRRLDGADDLRQHRLGADLVGTEDQAAGTVQSAAGDPRPSRLGDRHRLAREHGFVDVRAAVTHGAVDRHGFARTDAQHVAHPHEVQSRFDEGAVPLDACRPRTQAEKPLDRRAGLALGTRLKGATDQDERDDHRRGFEINLISAAREDVRRESRNRREAPGGGGAEHDERVHVGRAVPERRKTGAIEAQPGPKQHGGRQHERDEAHGPRADADGLEQMRKQVSAHREADDGQGQKGRDRHVTFQRGILVRLGLRASLDIAVGERTRREAGGGDSGIERSRIEPSRRFHRRTFGRQVDAGRADARHRPQRALDPAHARGAVHALDADLQPARRDGETSLRHSRLDRRHDRRAVRRGFERDIRTLRR